MLPRGVPERHVPLGAVFFDFHWRSRGQRDLLDDAFCVFSYLDVFGTHSGNGKSTGFTEGEYGVGAGGRIHTRPQRPQKAV